MQDEFNALLSNQTWSLVPRHPSMNIVGFKCVYKIKEKPNGSIEQYKAHLIAKGYNQQEGVNFTETFSPVVKPVTIRTVLSLSLTHHWPIRQLDVNNAFLHGVLYEEVYMEQPPGFRDSSHPTHVCRLHKAIYGLKQAPWAWFQKFSGFLLHYGFVWSGADRGMFVFRSSIGIMILLVYVDDIILTGSSSSLLHSFIRVLSQQFAMKDLGELHYFLGIEAKRTSTGLHLC